MKYLLAIFVLTFQNISFAEFECETALLNGGLDLIPKKKDSSKLDCGFGGIRAITISGIKLSSCGVDRINAHRIKLSKEYVDEESTNDVVYKLSLNNSEMAFVVKNTIPSSFMGNLIEINRLFISEAYSYNLLDDCITEKLSNQSEFKIRYTPKEITESYVIKNEDLDIYQLGSEKGDNKHIYFLLVGNETNWYRISYKKIEPNIDKKIIEFISTATMIEMNSNKSNKHGLAKPVVPLR